MRELVITEELRDKINNYLGYELIKRNEVGRHIYDEAPGLGRIGIEGNEQLQVVTNKQLDSNGNVEWYKSPNPMVRGGKIRPFHCRLTTVSAKKAKILIASLFPEEEFDKNFLIENGEVIETLREQMRTISTSERTSASIKDGEKHLQPHSLIIGPGELFADGAFYYLMISGKKDESSSVFLGQNETQL